MVKAAIALSFCTQDKASGIAAVIEIDAARHTEVRLR